MIVVGVDGYSRFDGLGRVYDAVVVALLHLSPKLSQLGHDRPVYAHHQ